MVGSAMTSCQFSIGTWLVMMVDPRWCVFRKIRDIDFGNSRTGISVIPGQGFR
jgi:hypothetical protein